MDEYDIPFNDSPNFIEPPNSNTTTIIIIALSCFFLLSIVGFVTFFMFNNSSTTSTTSTTISSASSNIKSGTQLRTQLSQQNKPLPKLPIAVPSNKEPRENITFNCYANPGKNLYTCADPSTDQLKNITLVDGPILKLSFSEEIQIFTLDGKPTEKKSLDYYILVPYAFIVDFVIDLSLGAFSIKTLHDLHKTFEKIETTFNKTNTIPDKCLKLKAEIRNAPKEPYNTTCIFFPGLSKLGALADTLEKVLLPYIPEQVQNEYFNSIDTKLQASKTPTLTILEYVLYLGMLNRIKKKKLSYVMLCSSNDDTLNQNIDVLC